MVSRMVKYVKGFSWTILAPLLMVSTVALALYILGTIPGHIASSERGIKEYNSVEDAESKLGFDIAIPAYFPNYLSWPPASIRGQVEPVLMSQMIFFSSDHHTEDLVITQVISTGEDLPVSLPWIDSILQKTPITINGKPGELIIGKRSDGVTVNGVYWRADGIYYAVITTHPVEEATTLAQSMHP